MLKTWGGGGWGEGHSTPPPSQMQTPCSHDSLFHYPFFLSFFLSSLFRSFLSVVLSFFFLSVLSEKVEVFTLHDKHPRASVKPWQLLVFVRAKALRLLGTSRAQDVRGCREKTPNLNEICRETPSLKELCGGRASKPSRVAMGIFSHVIWFFCVFFGGGVGLSRQTAWA